MKNNLTVFKYELADFKTSSIRMPLHAKILSVQMQFDKPVIWALVNPHAEKFESREFFIATTGEHFIEMGESGTYSWLATLQKNGGSRVLHLFEKINF